MMTEEQIKKHNAKHKRDEIVFLLAPFIVWASVELYKYFFN